MLVFYYLSLRLIIIFMFFEVRKRRRDVAFHIRVTSSSCCSKHGSEKQAP